MLQGGGKQGSPHMSRKTLDGPAGMIGGAHLPSAALLHEAKLGEQSDLSLLHVLLGLWLYYMAQTLHFGTLILPIQPRNKLTAPNLYSTML